MEFLAQGRRVRGVGVGDQDHVAGSECIVGAGKKLHLPDEGGIVRRVGEDYYRSQNVKQITFDNLCGRNWREGDDLFGTGRYRKKRGDGKGQNGKKRTTGEGFHGLDIGAFRQNPKRQCGVEWREL